MLVRFKTNADNTITLIDEGVKYNFDSAGIFLSESNNLLPKDLDGLLNLSIVSILSSNNNTEVLVYNNKTEKENIFNIKDSMSCSVLLSQQKGIVRILKRKGKYENIRYNQIVFVFNDYTDIESIEKIIAEV